MRYGFVIDQRKCIGCHACTVACKEENQVPLGVNRTWVKYIEKGVFPDTRRYFSVMRCNHCDNAPCVTICPTVVLYRRPDGIVDFDGDRCIGRIPSPGQPNPPAAPAIARASPSATAVTDGMDLPALARTVYDVAQPELPWGWKVAAYLWTKSIAAGAFLVASLGLAAGLLTADALVGLAVPVIGLAFLLLTSLLLVFDLKRPERFLYLVFKPNPRSWLVLGGFILFAAGLLGALWLLAGVMSNLLALQLLAWPTAAAAAATPGHSAFLFGQAEGRAFWQSPPLLPHPPGAPLVAGAASP